MSDHIPLKQSPPHVLPHPLQPGGLTDIQMNGGREKKNPEKKQPSACQKVWTSSTNITSNMFRTKKPVYRAWKYKSNTPSILFPGLFSYSLLSRLQPESLWQSRQMSGTRHLTKRSPEPTKEKSFLAQRRRCVSQSGRTNQTSPAELKQSSFSSSNKTGLSCSAGVTLSQRTRVNPATHTHLHNYCNNKMKR